MSTFRQVQANRRNAESSTGPKSVEGKESSRVNAVTHGLSATVVSSDEDAETVAKRLESWKPLFDLQTEDDAWHFSQMILSTVKLERCRHDELDLIGYFANRAETCWHEDRAVVAEELASRLSRRPGLIVAKLSSSLHGVNWLISHWKSLAAPLEEGLAWSDSDREHALDLLGIEGPCRDNSEALGGTPGDPETLQIIRNAIADLEEKKTEGLEHLDDFERSAAVKGFAMETPKVLALVRRYEAASMRRYLWAKKQLQEKPRGNLAKPEVPKPETKSSKPPVALPVARAEAEAKAEAKVEAEAEARVKPKSAQPPTQVELPLESEPQGSSRLALPASSTPMNRKQKRAMEKLATKRR